MMNIFCEIRVICSFLIGKSVMLDKLGCALGMLKFLDALQPLMQALWHSACSKFGIPLDLH